MAEVESELQEMEVESEREVGPGSDRASAGRADRLA